MCKKILITAGGTGGHIFPAQGLAQQLKRQSSQHEILFVAGGLSSNRYFDRTLFSFKEVMCSPLISKNPLKSLKGAFSILRGVCQSIQVLKDYQPDVVVGFGSYYTIPILLAAKWLKIPIILHEANSIPGKVNRWFAPYVASVGVHFPYTTLLLKGKAVEVGMPLREGYEQACFAKEEARTSLGIDLTLPTVLVFGGSQGARAINQLVKSCVESGFHFPIQIIHLTGDETTVSELSSLYAFKGIKACVKAFEKQMNRTWKAADVFIGRSGASTIAEAMEFAVPGILIPYPAATDQHQDRNADFLEEIGGGIKLSEKELTFKRLKEVLEQILKPSRLIQMHQAIQNYKQRPNSIDLCQLVLQTAEKSFSRD